MNAKDFERRLETLAVMTPREVDERMRGLRENGSLPIGGRGRQAPRIDEVHAAAMLLQLVPRRAVEADKYWLSRMDVMRFVTHPTVKEPFGGPTPEPYSLTHSLTNLLQWPAFSWLRLTVACDGYSARLLVQREAAVELFFTSRPDWASEAAKSLAAYQGLASGLLTHSFTLGAGAVKALARELAA